MAAAACRRPGLAGRSSVEATAGSPHSALTAGPDEATTADSPIRRPKENEFRYRYDADNRLLDVRTSADGRI